MKDADAKQADAAAGHNAAAHAYVPRIADTQINYLLAQYTAIEIEGVYGCGKATTAFAHARDGVTLRDSREHERALADPLWVLGGEGPRAVVEWRAADQVEPFLAREVARRGSQATGRWLLTSSTVPETSRPWGEVGAQGANPFMGHVRMRPLTLFETGDSTGEVSLRGLFDGDFEPLPCDVDGRTFTYLAARGGWPRALYGPDGRVAKGDVGSQRLQAAARTQLDSLLDRVAREFSLDVAVARLLVEALAHNNSTAATVARLREDMLRLSSGKTSLNELADDARHGAPHETRVRTRNAGVRAPTCKTIARYLDALNASYLLEEIPGWVPPTRDARRMQVKARRWFADPSLAIVALGVEPAAMTRSVARTQMVFSNLCMRDLLVYAQDVAFELCKHAGKRDDRPLVSYYRDDSGLETDVVIELPDGRWAALMLCLSEAGIPKAATSLIRLRNKLCRKAAAGSRMPDPSFLGVITGVGYESLRSTDGMYVIPLTMLRP